MSPKGSFWVGFHQKGQILGHYSGASTEASRILDMAILLWQADSRLTVRLHGAAFRASEILFRRNIEAAQYASYSGLNDVTNVNAWKEMSESLNADIIGHHAS